MKTDMGTVKRVMVIAGTKDGRDIIEELVKRKTEVVATVTTSYGKELLETCHGVEIHEGKLDSSGITSLVVESGISCIVDASHPFAREISTNAMKSCAETGIAYLRFERRDGVSETTGVIKTKSFEEAAHVADSFEGNILLTIGSNHIHAFTERITNYKDRLYARILPDSRMVAKCEAAGLSAGNIIALKGPFSEELNAELLRYCKAAVMVSKESGEAGGTDQKLRAAARLGIPVVLVERPDIDYTRQVSTIEEVMEFVSNVY